MTALIALAASACYVSGWALTARGLFRAWRPSRAPLCTPENHYPGNHPASGSQTSAWGLGHGNRCYQRRRPDLSLTDISTDDQATMKASLAAVLWPGVLILMFIRGGPPALEAELEARRARLREEIAAAEAELEQMRKGELR